jgi:hypothetical protein
MACPEGLGTARDERSESRRFHDGLADAASSLMEEARPAGLEPAAPGLEGRCSIQLSYGRNWKEVSV